MKMVNLYFKILELDAIWLFVSQYPTKQHYLYRKEENGSIHKLIKKFLKKAVNVEDKENRDILTKNNKNLTVKKDTCKRKRTHIWFMS